MINSVTLVGRLGQDPETKYFETGSVKARFSVAVDRPGAKNEAKVTDWFAIEAWGKLAEFAGTWLKKGSNVAVVGSVEVTYWTDNTGNQREQLAIRATEIKFVGSKASNSGGGGSGDFSANFPPL
ncbi:MAG: single-stranded DNA-binding protein [Vampirovibrionales bacterium]